MSGYSKLKQAGTFVLGAMILGSGLTGTAYAQKRKQTACGRIMS